MLRHHSTGTAILVALMAAHRGARSENWRKPSKPGRCESAGYRGCLGEMRASGTPVRAALPARFVATERENGHDRGG